jgi:hypothetical protein
MFEHYLKLAALTPTFGVSFVPGFERLTALLDAIEDSVLALQSAPESLGEDLPETTGS